MGRPAPQLVLALLAIVAGLALIAAGCGDDDDEGSATTTGTAEEVYFASLSDAGGAAVEIGTVILDPDADQDEATATVEEQLGVYEDAVASMSSLTLSDETLDQQRQDLVDTTPALTAALRDVIDRDSALDTALAVVAQREPILAGIEALAGALQGAAQSVEAGDSAALDQLLEDLEPIIQDIQEEGGG